MPEEPHPLQTLLERGYSVFPCKPHGKEPLVSWQPYQTKQPSPGLVQEWIERYPNCNVAIVTGSVSRLVVIDSDGAEGGISAARLGMVGHRTISVNTGNGWHYYFRYPSELPLGPIRNRVRFLPGLDIRADGGYVIAPPSIHPNGRRYGWYDFTRTRQGIPQELPEHIYQILMGNFIPPKDSERERGSGEREATVANGTAYGLAALKGEQGKVLRSRVGERNDQLNRSACKIGSLVASGLLPEHQAAQTLLDTAMAAGLPEQESRKTIQSGLKKGKENPRKVTLQPAQHGG